MKTSITLHKTTNSSTTRININNHSDSGDLVNAYLAKNTVTVCKNHNPGSKNRAIKCSKIHKVLK